MTRDSAFTHLHTHSSHHADLLESFTHPTSSQLAPEEIYIPHYLQPLNPEDEDDVVPDQHAAFGIQRATQGKKEVAWRDLGLAELARRAPGEGGAGAGNANVSGNGNVAVGGTGAAGTREEPVAVALRRRTGVGRLTGAAAGATETQGGGGAGNGMPR